LERKFLGLKDIFPADSSVYGRRLSKAQEFHSRDCGSGKPSRWLDLRAGLSGSNQNLNLRSPQTNTPDRRDLSIPPGRSQILIPLIASEVCDIFLQIRSGICFEAFIL
jgi:hypothetical protein